MKNLIIPLMALVAGTPNALAQARVGLSGYTAGCPSISQRDSNPFSTTGRDWPTACETEFQARLSKATNAVSECGTYRSHSDSSFNNCIKNLEQRYSAAYQAKSASAKSTTLNSLQSPSHISAQNSQLARGPKSATAKSNTTGVGGKTTYTRESVDANGNPIRETLVQEGASSTGAGSERGLRNSDIKGIGRNAQLESLEAKSKASNQIRQAAQTRVNDAKNDWKATKQNISDARKSNAESVTFQKTSRDGLNKNVGTGKWDVNNVQTYANGTTVKNSKGEDVRNYAPTKRELKEAYKATIVEEKAKLKEANKQAKADAKDKEKLQNQLSIQRENTSGQYGGLYGGADQGKTDVINKVVEVGTGLAMSASEAQLQNRNGNEQVALQAKGMNANQVDALKTQVKMLTNGQKSSNQMALVTTMAGVVQGMRVADHYNSQKKVDVSAQVANDDVDAKQALGVANGGISAEQADFIRQNIAANQEGEKKKQSELAFQQAGQVAQTMMKAAKLRSDANAMKQQAAMVEGYAAAQQGGGFTYNPGGGVNPNTPGDDPNSNPNNNGQVTNTDPTDPALAGGDDLFNPNPGGDGVEGPQAGQFVAGKTDGGAGGASGGGMGGTSGTSAAKDDSKGAGEAPGKAQAGGAFAAGEGGSGSRFSRAGGGGGGADNNWLEMMKKFLPGGDELAKHEGERLDLTERGLASDQPAVLGRNQNIFEEISKKYQKKNTEGAIVFSGDRT